MNSRPNILFLIADDHQHDAIGQLGHPVVSTPNLDRLVQRGTSLTQTYIMGSTSDAVCMPSRGMMLTGRSLFRIDAPDLGDWLLWPQLLRRHGYHTHGIGKWHNLPPSFTRCFDSGAEIFFGGMSDHEAVPVSDFDPTGAYPESGIRTGRAFSTDLFADAAVDFLHTHDAGQPFCLYLAFTAPHDPRTPPPAYAELYEPDDMPVTDNFLPEHPFDNGEMRIRDELLAPFPRTPQVIQQHLADYFGMISHMDAGIGRIFAALEAAGQADNTIVVYTADHGLALGQHGLLGKQNYVRSQRMRVPFVITGPGIPRNRRIDALCYLHDWYPTAVRSAGIWIYQRRPKDNHSKHFVWASTATHRDTIFSAYLDVQRMVRDDHWYKLIEYFVGDKPAYPAF